MKTEYTPNTEHVERRKPDRSDPPRLWVRYRCPICDGGALMDAYMGVPRCQGGVDVPRHRPEVMKGISLA